MNMFALEHKTTSKSQNTQSLYAISSSTSFFGFVFPLSVWVHPTFDRPFAATGRQKAPTLLPFFCDAGDAQIIRIMGI